MSSDFEVKLFINYVKRRTSLEFDNESMGELAVNIVNVLLSRNEYMSDEKAISLVNANPTDVRKVLQFLYRLGVIDLVRETTNQYRYEYKWSLSRDKISRFIRTRINNIVEKLTHIVRELSSSTPYLCPTCFKRYSLDEAYDFNFECPRDKTPLVQIDVTSEVTYLNKIIKELRER